MRLRPVIALVAALVVSVATFVPGASVAAEPLGGVTAKLQAIRGTCGLGATVGFSHCNLWLMADADARPFATTAPTGLGPADLQSAYALGAAAASAGGNQTVAIVDAYDDKTAEADLGVYRSNYGLPACTTANGCFKKVNQSGVQGSYPTNDQGWAVEISLDLQMVSAACPHCHILLVEATSNSNANLYAAEDTAARMGTVVSNSYGGAEASTETTDDAHFNHPGVPITVSSGDSGYGVEYPAASRYVTAVGGTTLTKTTGGRGWTEAAWSGAGSGCSAYETIQAWESSTGCARRTVADVSAVADPNSGVAVYDSNCNIIGQLGGTCFKGWGTVGGTSASAPIIAAVYALAGNGASTSYASYPYAHLSGLNDVVTGTNGSCSGSYLCTAGAGYDGPTGLGTPNGTSGF